MALYIQKFKFKNKYGQEEEIKLDKLEDYVRRLGPDEGAKAYKRVYATRPMREEEFYRVMRNAVAYLRKRHIYKGLAEELHDIQNS